MTTPPNAPDNSKSKLGAVLLVDDEKPLLELYA